MASKGRRRDRIFFIYDHGMLKKEEDDPKNAILFFTPDSVSDDTQCSIVGHLMGMMDFLSSTVSISHPSVIKLETDKYIMKRVNRYSMVLQGFPNESNIHLTNQLEHLYKCFVTFQGSIDSLSLRFKGRHATFLAEFKSIWTEILDHGGFDQNLLTQAFNYLSYVDLPKNASHLFLQASHILQCSQRRPYVLAGVILYKNGVVCSQLTPELTKLLILAQSQLPCFLLHTDFEMPLGCKLLTVFLTDDDYFSVHPLHPDAKRHYKVAEFSKHRESVVITKDKTQSRTEKSPKRPQPYPQEGDNKSHGQRHSRISLSRKEISSWSDRRQITSIVGVPLVECKSGERKEEEEIGVMHGFSAQKNHFEDRDGKQLIPNNKDNKKSKYEIQSDTHSEPCREKDRIDPIEKNKESQKKNTENSENAARAKFEVGGSTEEETVSELENGDIDKTHEKSSQEVEGNTSGTNKLHNINSDESELETLDIGKYSIEVNVDSDGFVFGTDKHLLDHDSVVHTDVPRVEDEFPSSESQQGNTTCNKQTTYMSQFKTISANLIEENKIPSSEKQQDNTKCNEQTTTATQLESFSASRTEENKIPSSENQQDNTNEQTTTVTQLEAISASLIEENKIPSSENQQDNTKCNEQTTTVTQLEAVSASFIEENKIPSSENQQDNTKCNEQTTTVTQLEAISASLIEENKIPSSENQQDNTKCNEQTTTVTQLEAVSASLIEENKIPSSENQQDNTECNEQTTTATQLESFSASLIEENKIPSSEKQQDNTKCNEQTTTATQLESFSASRTEENKIPSSEKQQDNTNEQTTTVTQLEAISASLIEENKIPSSENQQDNTKCNEQITTFTQLEAVSASLIEENKIPSSENQQDNTKCNEQTTTVTQLEAISACLIDQNNSDRQQVLETEKEQILCHVKDDISVQEQEHLNNIEISVTEACNNETGVHGRAQVISKVLVAAETLKVATESGNTEKTTDKVSVSDLENYKTESEKQTVRKSLLLISSIARSGLHSNEEKENIDPELNDASETHMAGKPVAEQTNYGLIDNLSKKSSTSFSSSEDMPSSTQLGQEQFQFQSHSSGSNNEVMTSEEVKDIMTSFVSHDNKAEKQNTVQRELDDSVKNISQKGMTKTSFLGSFSSDQSSDSTLSKVWTPDMDGLNDLTLYVQRHSDISLLLLLENPVQNEEAVLHMLWKSAVPPIADLDFYVKECLEQSADKQSFLDQYNYLKYEGLSHKLKGNSLDILENSELPFQQLASNIHEEFLGSQYMYDVLLRTQTYACHGHRTPVAEHYFQLNVPSRLTSGLPVPNDPVFCLDQLARKKMANTSNAIL